MNAQEKLAKIAEFRAGGRAFDDVIGLPPEVLAFRPFPEAWTIHEQAVHVLEAEIQAFHRYRKAIAEPGGLAVAYDEDLFHDTLDYPATDLADALACFRLLRTIAAAHLERLVHRDWDTIAYRHDKRGMVSLATWIDDYIGHVRMHRDLIDRNLRLWSQR